MPDGAVLPARFWGDPAAPIVVLALHGFNDSRDGWEYPAPIWAATGVALYAPDQRGFGATASRGHWPGADRLADDALACLTWLRQTHPTARLVLMGESMGGAVSMLVASRHRHAMDATVLLAPAVWGRGEMNAGYTAALWLATHILPGMTVTGRNVPVRIRASDNQDALIRLAQDPLTLRRSSFRSLGGLVDLMDQAQIAAPAMPDTTLCLYGARDQLVPAHAMARMWGRLPPMVRRAYYPNGYHLLLRDNARSIPTGDAMAWMQDPGAALPSSAELAAAAWMAGGAV